ncbi:MAG TPA: class I SAM-dependent methyltransferase [Candidatus Paceibacterota bacterium]|nr:class I SAM-dependent methyltransferase [Candidatus Paceibacterota bacterium]
MEWKPEKIPLPVKSAEQYSEFSQDVQTQLENLRLTPEMVTGKILDIGASDAQFAKDFSKKEGVEIVSIDSNVPESEKGLVIEADARKLPFGDGSFDMVISHASMPHIFIGMYSHEHPEHSKGEITAAIQSSLDEMVRVLKPGKKAYMAPILFAEDYEPQRIVAEAILGAIGALKERGVAADLSHIREYVNPVNHEKTNEYRLILEKPII